MSSSRVVVITAPAGAGKTAAAMELYRRRLDELARPGCLLIVPNALAAEQMRRRLLGESLAGVLVAPAVTTFANLAWAVISAAGMPAHPLRPAQRRLLLEGIVAKLAAAGELRALGPVADTPGLIDAIDAGIAELKRAAVEPDALAAAADPASARHADLLAVYRLYQQRLQEAGRYDLEGRMWLARDVLAGDGQAPLGYENITAVAVDGFTDFTPTQLEILAALAGRVEKMLITLALAEQSGAERVWFWTARTLERIGQAIPAAETVAIEAAGDPLRGLFDHSADVPATEGEWVRSLAIIEAPSIEAEVRAVARAVKADLAAGGGAIGVIARDLAAYAEPVERIFAAHDIPVARRPAALGDSNIVRYVLRALALGGEYYFHDVLAVIRNSYFRPSALGDFDELSVATAEMTIRAANVLGGRESYRLAFERVARAARERLDERADDEEGFALGALAADAECIERAGAMLEALLSRLDALAGKSAAAYAGEVRRLIEELQVRQAAAACDADEVVAADLRALRAFEELLDDLAAEDLPAGAVGPAELLARCAGAAAAPAARGQSLVTVADVLDARALRFERVYLLGVNERTFPTLAQERCFIGEADRAAWAERGVALDRRSDMLAREMLLFYLAATRADLALTVSYLTADATGRSHSPSIFVDRLIAAAQRRGVQPEWVKIAPGSFVPAADELASRADAFNAAVLAAFEGRSGGGDDGRRLLGWVAEHQDQLLRRASFGILAGRRRWRRGQVDAFDGRIDEPDLLACLAERIPGAWTFSATELNMYARCPWQFFARYLLCLEPLAEPAAQMTPADRGIFCHAVLWQAMSRLRDEAGGAVAMAQVAESTVRDALDEAVQAERDRLAARAVHPRLWTAQTQAWREMLWQYLLGQRERAAEHDDRMLHFELAFGPTGMRDDHIDPASLAEPVELSVGGHRIRLQGKIDRVDRIATDDGPQLLAVDYKTGTVPSAKDISAARDLQLALYVAALEVIFADVCGGGVYHGLRTDERRYFAAFKENHGRRVPVDEYEEMYEHAISAVGACVDNMRRGAFDALPAHGCPKWCPYRQICHYSPRRARRKTGEAAGREGGGE